MDVTDAELAVRDLSDALTAVAAGECLSCYLLRMLDAFGCVGTHRFTERWRDAQARPMPWLLGWVRANGGVCCDCEVALNVFAAGARTRRHQQLQCAAAYLRALREAALEDPDALDVGDLDGYR